MPGPVSQPPSLFPTLENKPQPLISTVEQEYLLVVHKNFNDTMKSSPFYLKSSFHKIHSSDSYPKTVEDEKELAILWSRMPSELKIKKAALKRPLPTKGQVKPKLVKRSPEADASTILKKLEEREKMDIIEIDQDDEEKPEEKAKDADEDEDEKSEAEEEVEEMDEELDQGTDYANAYFDNGEAYLDEEDNPNDEPVY